MVFGMNYTDNIASTMKMVAAMTSIIPVTLTPSITREHAGKNEGELCRSRTCQVLTEMPHSKVWITEF